MKHIVIGSEVFKPVHSDKGFAFVSNVYQGERVILPCKVEVGSNGLLKDDTFQVIVTRNGTTMIVPIAKDDADKNDCLLFITEDVGWSGRKTAYVTVGAHLLKVNSGIRLVSAAVILTTMSSVGFVTERGLVLYHWDGENMKREESSSTKEGLGLRESYLSPRELF